MRLKSVAGLLAAMLLAAPQASFAGGTEAIRIVSAQFGAPGAAHPRNFAERLQQTCGPESSSCETFCSETALGLRSGGWRLPFSAAPVCRVVYRCGDASTVATEASTNEVLYLTCNKPG